MLSEWRIYYFDGSTFDDSQGPWDRAPQEGVLCVAVVDRERPVMRGRWLLTTTDYYVHLPGDKYPWNVNGLIPTLTKVFGVGWVPPNPWPDQDAVRAYLGTLIHPRTLLPMLRYVKFGVTVDYEDWSAVVDKAYTDPDLPAPLTPGRRASDAPEFDDSLLIGVRPLSMVKVRGGP